MQSKEGTKVGSRRSLGKGTGTVPARGKYMGAWPSLKKNYTTPGNETKGRGVEKG